MTPESPAVRTLLDRCDVEAVCTSYALALDSRAWERLRNCFTEDCVVEYDASGTFTGPDAVVDACRTALGPLSASQHFLTNFDITVDGDAASSVCYFAAQHVAKHGLFMIGGTYTDRWSRTGDGWRIAHRRLTHTWESGDPAVLFAHSDLPKTGRT